MLKHIIFDYDGVLVDSFQFHLDKYNELFDIGLTSQELQDAHNGNFYDHKSPKFDRISIQDYVSGVALDQEFLPLREDAHAVLNGFSKTHTLHLVTSGWQRQILPNLQHHHIDKLFKHRLFADHGKDKHEKILQIIAEEKASADDCVFVTDTLGDIYEAKQVPITCIAISGGFHPETTLIEGEPDHLVHSWKELRDVIKNYA